MFKRVQPKIGGQKSRHVQNKIKKSRILVEFINDYCENSTLHGVKYMETKKYSCFEIIWWVVSFVASVAVCSFLISKAWIKWKNNPVILSFEKEQIPIWKVPFPAVTVCPVNKVEQTVYNYTKAFRMRDNLPLDEYKKFWDISLVCNLEQYLVDLNSTIIQTNDEAIKNIENVGPQLASSILSILWQSKEADDLFVEHITEEGVCFTFNALGQTDMYTENLNPNITFIKHDMKNKIWSIDSGYVENSNKDDHPRRTASDGSSSGLSIILISKKEDIDYVCGLPVTGFKVVLHNPAEIPKVSQQYFLVPTSGKLNLNIKPDVTTTSQNLLNMPVYKRNCYFSHEKTLKFFKVYTQTNCWFECDASIIKAYCGCVPFYMPREKGVPICGFASLDCIQYVNDLGLSIDMAETIMTNTEKEKETIKYIQKIIENCDCLPSCSNLQYSAETSLTHNYILKALLATGLYTTNQFTPSRENIENEDITATHIKILFKESQFMALHRSELYEPVDFLGNCGGLLGLFLGFSILSLVEIVYFLTLRCFTKYKKVEKIKDMNYLE